MSVIKQAEKWIESHLSPVRSWNRAAGGSGWSCYSRGLLTNGKQVFVKTSDKASLVDMYLGEALGLQALRATGSVTVPEVYHYEDCAGGGSFLVMEHLDMNGRLDPGSFGRVMAEMHLAEPLAEEAKEGKFGFSVDNTIGATPQVNGWMDNWVDFFREKRIGFQVNLADDADITREWERCLRSTDGLRNFFRDIEVKPSTLHGDLWSGNVTCVGNQACVFDPAAYYGHHEAEWGMSWCSSFPPAFWKGYRSLIPEDPGFHRRADLYELYHKLNHFNLFGSCYRGDALRLMRNLSE